MAILTKSSLSPSRKKLVELMQRINFGRIENLALQCGDPVLDRDPPRVILEVKLAGENGPRSESVSADFALKPQLADLFIHFDRLGDAQIEVLSVKHGLPFTMHVEDAA